MPEDQPLKPDDPTRSTILKFMLLLSVNAALEPNLGVPPFETSTINDPLSTPKIRYMLSSVDVEPGVHATRHFPINELVVFRDAKFTAELLNLLVPKAVEPSEPTDTNVEPDSNPDGNDVPLIAANPPGFAKSLVPLMQNPQNSYNSLKYTHKPCTGDSDAEGGVFNPLTNFVDILLQST